MRRLPKLSLAVATSCHLVLAARATTGGGSDHPHFEPLLFDAWRRAGVAVVVADAGYDSEANHRVGRLELGVQTVIPPDIGRPSESAPTGPSRAEMRARFDRPEHDEMCGQRWQVEAANSMVKRNLGSALRATTAHRRSMALLLRVLTYNIMVLEGTEP